MVSCQADGGKLRKMLEIRSCFELPHNGSPAHLVVGVGDVHFDPDEIWAEFKEEPYCVYKASTTTRSEGNLVRLQVLPEGAPVDPDDLLLQSSPKSTLDPKRP